MAGSRAAHNAKLVQRHQRQQSNTLAKTSANKFTQKQSQFERRREEAQVRQQQADTGFTAGRNAGDGLLSRAATAAGRGRGYATPGEEEVRNTPNLFARTGGVAAGPTTRTAAPATTRSATMGLERVAPRTTRTTRRIDRFNLTAGSGTGEPAASSLMGVRRVREGEVGGLDGLGGGDAAAAPPSKVTRAERFREVMSSSKGQRAQLQRERAERDAATVQLDAEINGLLHLLPKRNKLQEEQEAFEQSGTPEVRALLASYKLGHEAKCLTLKSSGAFEVRTLGEAARSTATQGPVSAPAAGADAAAEAAPAFLDAADRALLARVRTGAARSSEEGAEDADAVAAAAAAAHGAVKVSRQAAADAADARAAPRGAGDDFDAMMQSFLMDPRRAHAVARTLTEEEEALQAAQQALLREDRQQVPALNLQDRDQTQLTRGEWVAQGGDVAFHMDDDDGEGAADDNVDLPSSFEGDSDGGDDGDDVEADAYGAAGEDDSEMDGDGTAGAAEDAAERVGGSAALHGLLAELEAIATAPVQTDELSGPAAVGTRGARLHAVLTRLHRYATRHVVEVTKAFRLILVEAERSFLRGTRKGGMRQTLLVYLYAITKVFPASDYRHPVVTPFLLFVCSALMQMRLDSCEAVHSYLVLAALLLHCLKAGAGRYCAEVVVAALNVLALQLPRAALEPARYQGTTLPVPLLDRIDGVLLDSSASAGDAAAGGGAAAAAAPHQLGLFDTTHTPERLLLGAYRLLEEVCALHRSTPAFPVMCAAPFIALDALLLRPPSTWTPSPAVRLAHEALCVAVRDTAKGVEAHRTPLAMRTFRPRPLRQFDPLLAEREENAVKNEVRIMKRDIREDKKRLMRHLTAEATVQRRAQEKRQAVDDAQREKRYHNVMHQLQQQQHSMNAVESLKARAKSKSRKGLSGASSAAPAEDAGGD